MCSPLALPVLPARPTGAPGTNQVLSKKGLSDLEGTPEYELTALHLELGLP